MKADDPPVVVEQLLSATPEAVWRSLTEVDLMRQWFFANIPSFKPEAGFETHFDVESNGRIFPHRWKITEVTPLRKIAYNWKYDAYPGGASVEFALFPEGASTRLRLTVHIHQSFPDDIPEFTRESCVQGWEYFIQQSLKKFLEGT